MDFSENIKLEKFNQLLIKFERKEKQQQLVFISLIKNNHCQLWEKFMQKKNIKQKADWHKECEA